MSSILTNNSAMVALQTLKGINSSLAKTQSEISTGKTVGSAKDDAAVWAISKVMEADVEGFQEISSSLSLGGSTVSVARQAAEAVGDLLTEMKGKIVSAQEDNMDRDKLQTDIEALTEQVRTVIGSASFNGLNLVDGSAGASVDILASLDRTGSTVSTSAITVNTQDLSIGAYTAKAAFTGSDGVTSNADAAGFKLDNLAAGTNTGALVIDAGVNFDAGDSLSVTIGDKTATYTLTAEDVAATTTSDLAAAGLKNAIDALGIEGLTVDYDSSDAGKLSFTNGGDNDLVVSAQFENAGSGGLAGLSSIDVRTDAGAAAALGNIESLMQTAIDAAADFGSAEMRIEIQSDFLGKLTDSLKSGIGAMVDADMEETSARLQALQTQQQLGVQSLSIANEAPQTLLSLFR